MMDDEFEEQIAELVRDTQRQLNQIPSHVRERLTAKLLQRWLAVFRQLVNGDE